MRTLLGSLIGALILTTAAQGGVISFASGLSGAAEAPPNASPGTGFAFVTYDETAHTLQVDITFSGLNGDTTASHIHCCTAVPGAGTAGVATMLPNFVGFPLGVKAGSYNQTFNLLQSSSWNPAFITNNGGTAAGAEARLLAGLLGGQAYLNIHSTFAAGGEIRGFLAETPEPATGLLTAAAGLALWMWRRRRTAS